MGWVLRHVRAAPAPRRSPLFKHNSSALLYLATTWRYSDATFPEKVKRAIAGNRAECASDKSSGAGIAAPTPDESAGRMGNGSGGAATRAAARRPREARAELAQGAERQERRCGKRGAYARRSAGHMGNESRGAATAKGRLNNKERSCQRDRQRGPREAEA